MTYCDKKEIYERKEIWAEKRMLKNSEAETLTEEQHNVLAWLCSIRHKLHCDWESVFYNNSDAIDPFNNSIGECEVNKNLSNAGLEKIDFDFEFDEMPTINDYDNLLTEEEQEEWEKKAEEFNQSNPKTHHTGMSIWMEESDEYNTFTEQMKNINDKIEEYLRKIDEKHNTNYCPSGATRIY